MKPFWMDIVARWRDKRVLAQLLLLLLVLVLRLGFSALIFARPGLATAPDTKLYQDVARGLQAHEAYAWNTHDNAELLRTIGYPLFLAGISSIFGPAAGYVAIAQLIVSSAMILVVYFYLRNVVSGAAALISALLLAIDPLTLLWSLTILTEGLFTLFLLVAVVLVCRWAATQRRYSLLFGGIFIGLACLVRPIGQAFVGIGAIAVLLFPTVRVSLSRSELLPRIKNALWFAVPAVLIIAPWVVRNALLWDCPTLASVDRITMRDFVAAKVVSEVDHITLAQAQQELEAQDSSACPQKTGEYMKIVLAHPLIAAQLQVAGTIPVIIGTSFDRWLQLFGIDYQLPDLWGPFLDGGPGAALSILGDQFAKFPLALSLMVVLLAFQLILYGFAIRGALSVAKTGSTAIRWPVILIAATALALIIAPGQGGNERFRVPVQPLFILLVGHGLPFEPQRASRHSASKHQGPDEQPVSA
jgi:4-amino-4-deoxy-L-arabinose transferase-like glycosyltransferase